MQSIWFIYLGFILDPNPSQYIIRIINWARPPPPRNDVILDHSLIIDRLLSMSVYRYMTPMLH